MEPLEYTIQSFIVKIWIEETSGQAKRAVWRGHITHVPSGTRRYFKDLGGMIDFMAPYLEGMGADPGLGWRIRRQLLHWFHSTFARLSKLLFPIR